MNPRVDSSKPHVARSNAPGPVVAHGRTADPHRRPTPAGHPDEVRINAAPRRADHASAHPADQKLWQNDPSEPADLRIEPVSRPDGRR